MIGTAAALAVAKLGGQGQGQESLASPYSWATEP